MNQLISNHPPKEQIYTTEWVKAQAKSITIKRRAETIKRILSKTDALSVLDIGCGSGVTVETLWKAGYAACGLDSQTVNIDYCKSHKRGEFILADAGELPDIQYNAITATHILEHVINPEEVVINIKNHLSPGGYIIISVPNLSAYSERSLWRRSVANLINDPDHLWAFTPEYLRGIFYNNGIETVQLFTHTETEFIITGFLRTIYHWIKRKPLTITSADIYTPLVSKKTIKLVDRIVRILGIIIDPIYFEPHGEKGVELTIIGRVK